MDLDTETERDELLQAWATYIDEELLVNNMAQAGRFLNVARTDNELHGLSANVRADQREALDQRTKDKLHQGAIEALPTKFALISLSEDKDKMKNAYNVMMRTQEFFARLDKYDMVGPFVDVLEVTVNPNQRNQRRMNLGQNRYDMRENALAATEIQVRASNAYYNLYGQNYDVQNLVWSQELLENSCEGDLRDKVMESILQVPVHERGGPLFYRIMMGLITSSTAEATRAMVNRITSLKIRDIAGENIDSAVSTIRAAMQHLTTAHAVPSDIKYLLVDKFSKTSNKEFNDTFTTLRSNWRIGRGNNPNADNDTDVEDILEIAQATYHDLLECGEWNAPTTHNFLTCWNCNEEGHAANKCPKPKDENKMKENREKFMKNKEKDGREGGRGRGRGRGRGKGRGFGRGGRANKSEKPKTDEMEIPPTKKGMTTRYIAGQEHFWCHKCQRWNTSHLTANHAASVAPAPAPAPAATPSVNTFRETIFQGTRGTN
jgi:Zinc knuckle